MNVAFTGFARSTKNVSFGSRSELPLTRTSSVRVVTAGANTSWPAFATKSPAATDAVPSAVAKLTETVFSDGAESVTVNWKVVVPALPSLIERSLIERVGAASSSRIVPRAWLSPIVALADGLERFTKNVSSSSSVVSPATCTVTVC